MVRAQNLICWEIRKSPHRKRPSANPDLGSSGGRNPVLLTHQEERSGRPHPECQPRGQEAPSRHQQHRRRLHAYRPNRCGPPGRRRPARRHPEGRRSSQCARCPRSPLAGGRRQHGGRPDSICRSIVFRRRSSVARTLRS